MAFENLESREPRRRIEKRFSDRETLRRCWSHCPKVVRGCRPPAEGIIVNFILVSLHTARAVDDRFNGISTVCPPERHLCRLRVAPSGTVAII